MKELIKIHIHHYFNLRFLIITSLSICIMNGIYFFIARDAISYHTYFQTCFAITKTICTLFAIFCFVFYLQFNHDSYSYLILPLKTRRFNYMASKIILFYSFFFAYIVVLFCCFLIIGFCNQSVFYWDNNYLLYFHLFFIIIIYGMDAVILSYLLKNQLAIILVFLFFIVSNNIAIHTDNVIITIYLFLFPNGEMYFSNYLLLFCYDCWYGVILAWIIFSIYGKIDIQI